MNCAVLMGRLTAEPDVRYSNNNGEQTATARYTLAVDRKGKDNGADFIRCVAFRKQAEFAEKYLRKGTKIIVRGRIQTGSYKNKDGQTVYTTEVIVEDNEFAESKNQANNGSNQSNGTNYQGNSGNGQNQANNASGDGFMSIPDGVEDEQLPFN